MQRSVLSIPLTLTLVLAACSETDEPFDVGSNDAGGSDVGLADTIADAGLDDLARTDTGVREDLGTDAGVPVEPPAALTRYQTGPETDVTVGLDGPVMLLMGGGPEVDAALVDWTRTVNGGDVVVLRTSGSDGYNDYLLDDIGGIDSVETLLVTSRALADHAYVAQQLRNAEGIWLAGGDQSTYLEYWMGTEVESELRAAWQRGAALGGTSAGCAVMGSVVFAAYSGSVTSATALADPYHPNVTLETEFLDLPVLAGVITDSHFRERDRMGRLVTFLARIVEDGLHSDALGLGFDERTAMLIDRAGVGTVYGRGRVYAVRASQAAETCDPGTPLSYSGLRYDGLAAGMTITLPSGTTLNQSLSVNAGQLTPADPY